MKPQLFLTNFLGSRRGAGRWGSIQRRRGEAHRLLGAIDLQPQALRHLSVGGVPHSSAFFAEGGSKNRPLSTEEARENMFGVVTIKSRMSKSAMKIRAQK